MQNDARMIKTPTGFLFTFNDNSTDAGTAPVFQHNQTNLDFLLERAHLQGDAPTPGLGLDLVTHELVHVAQQDDIPPTDDFLFV